MSLRHLSDVLSTSEVVEREVQQDAAYSGRYILECKFHEVGILVCFFHCPTPIPRKVPGT